MNFLHFLTVMNRLNAFTPSRVYRCTRAHLDEFYGWCTGPMGELYDKHYVFISSGLDHIRDELTAVNNNPLDVNVVLETYYVLLYCLNLLVPVLKSGTLLYDHWVGYIRLLISLGEYNDARTRIPEFMGSLGLVNNVRRIVLPAYATYTHHNKCAPLTLLDILEGYIKCLSQSDLGVDFAGLVDVIEELDEWFKDFDGDMARRKRLVEYLMQSVEFDDGDASAKLFAIALIEHAKVCKDDHMRQLGVTFVMKKERHFLFQVLRHLALKFPVELEDRQGTNECTWCINQLQSYEERGCLSHTICITMESIISYRILEDMLQSYKSPHLLMAMNLISNARTLREKKANDCLENLNNAIQLCKSHANENDQGPSCFLQAQALCLLSLCQYEDDASHLKTFIRDMNKALMLWSNNSFVNDNECILEYTTKLLVFVFDVLITDHNEDSHELMENILNFIKKSDGKAGMLWQFKSHHIHIESEMIHNHFQKDMIERCFVANYGDLMEEGEINNKRESMISYIEVGWSLKSDCLLAHLYHDLSERMLVMGSMTKALKYAREGLRVRYRLIQESSVPPRNNRSGEYALLMNFVVAARIWSFTPEDFLLPPNNNLVCCLMSIHLEATILELMGNGIQALEVLVHGKTLSLQQGSSFFAGRFQTAIGKIHRKAQVFKLAEVELKKAIEQCRHISCRKCKLLLDVEISKESVKHMRKKGSHFQATKDDLVSAASMLREEVIKSKGCEGWGRSCTFSLLSVLTEIGKDYIFKDRTMEAQNVFLETIKLVVTLSSIPSAKSQRKFSSFVEFFDFIKTSEIKFSCGTHVAHIIYMISWLAYKMSKDTRENRVDHFSIPIEKLISTLKVSLVLSSEVPELFAKVAQLLAIMYFVSHEEIYSPKVTCFQWACFFQQLTVGSDVNYAFSHKLREVYGVSNPDNTLHGLTPSADADLTEFVTKFFEDLQPHTILVINIIGKKYKYLLKTLLQSSLPSDCVALIMVSRFNSKRQPLVGLFPVDSVPRTPSHVESGEPWRVPWGTDTIVNTIAPEFNKIIKDYHTSKSRTVLYTLDNRIGTFMSRMQSWFGLHKYVLLGEPVGSPTNSNLDYFSGFVGIGVTKSLASTTYGVSSSYGGKSEGTSKREPVILVLDKNINMFPWEGMEALKNHEYYRMPSVASTFYSYYVCDKSGRKTERDSAVYAMVNPFDAYYVISPDKSFRDDQCEKELGLAKYLKEKLLIDGKLWEHVGDVILEILKTRSFFMYAGHGNGLNHIPGGGAALRTLDRCASASLMGCCSGLLKLTGPYTPIGAPIEYLLAGSPIVITNLYNIYTSWSSYLYHKLLTRCKFQMSRTRESDFGSCLVTARNSTNKLLMSCGTICYGVPTLIPGKEQPENSVSYI